MLAGTSIRKVPLIWQRGDIIGQGDALGLVVLYVFAVVREYVDAGQVDVGLSVLADAVEINQRHGRGLE